MGYPFTNISSDTHKRLLELEKAAEERDKYFRIKVYEYSAMMDKAKGQIESIVNFTNKKLISTHEITYGRNLWVEEKVDKLMEKMRDVVS